MSLPATTVKELIADLRKARRIRGERRYRQQAADEEEKGGGFVIHDFPPVYTVLYSSCGLVNKGGER